MDRRTALKSSPLVFMGLSLPSLVLENSVSISYDAKSTSDKVPKHFPHVDPEIISEVVGKSHFDLKRVKELVDARPELSNSVWEWRFGDFESAIGAASHVGRRDIVSYLLSKGARPCIFSFAMMGSYEVVKSVVEFVPGIQKSFGPHGISLLDHAYAGERMKNEMTNVEVENLIRTIEYLESLGDAGGENYLKVDAEEQKKYLGDYKYGEEKKEGFTIQLNNRGIMSLGPIGDFGGALYKTAENKFVYNGAPSVIITFDIQDDIVKSLTLSEPGLTIIANKVS